MFHALFCFQSSSRGVNAYFCNYLLIQMGGTFSDFLCSIGKMYLLGEELVLDTVTIAQQYHTDHLEEDDIQKHSVGSKTSLGTQTVQKEIQTGQRAGQETYRVACSVSSYPEAVNKMLGTDYKSEVPPVTAVSNLSQYRHCSVRFSSKRMYP